MDGMMGVVTYGLGTILGFVLIGGLVVADHSGRHAEEAHGPAQLPGHRAAALLLRGPGRVLPPVFLRRRPRRRCRSTARRAASIYRLAKNEGSIIGFGSTNDLREPGSIIFVNHAFPVLEEERLPTPSLIIGEGYCRQPFEARSIVNISGMSFGAISAPAVRSLSRGAKRGRLLDGHRRGRPLAASPRRRLRHHHADGHREVRHAQPRRQLLAGEAEGAGAAREGVRDQAVAGREAGQGRRAAGRQGDRGDRAHPRHTRRARTRSAPTATTTSPTWTSCSTRSPTCAT